MANPPLSVPSVLLKSHFIWEDVPHLAVNTGPDSSPPRTPRRQLGRGIVFISSGKGRKGKRNLKEFVLPIVSVCLPVVCGPCVCCQSVCPTHRTSGIQPRPAPSEWTHCLLLCYQRPLRRPVCQSKCCTPCAGLTGGTKPRTPAGVCGTRWDGGGVFRGANEVDDLKLSENLWHRFHK